jgi:transposase-like protein
MENNTSVSPMAELVSAGAAAPDVSLSPREHWRQIIQQQRESGLGVSAFCRQRSIRTSTFYGWRQKLNRGRTSAAVRTRNFVRVKLATPRSGPDGARGVAAPSPGAVRAMPLEIRVRGGRRLVVRRGFERDLLVELIGMLEGLARAPEGLA